ncbi:hypothetical protein [Planctomicrobium piriforme]|uniref:Uncharacterized protein n=1 Tax=Planctomicrobium piriforme TaxID=1576369 RepID=A0A1I3G4J3_9PLAN|nr:hypothetical protein [Planctomicrobium piriforme]SFI18418.1 hypothetical protein SAMN05421753_106181 [Planctomicrobium piriforme]
MATLSELDALYIELLRRGLPALQLAVYSGNDAWMKAEIEFLHNVPSLIGEDNLHRHSYSWNFERVA